MRKRTKTVVHRHCPWGRLSRRGSLKTLNKLSGGKQEESEGVMQSSTLAKEGSLRVANISWERNVVF